MIVQDLHAFRQRAHDAYVTFEHDVNPDVAARSAYQGAMLDTVALVSMPRIDFNGAVIMSLADFAHHYPAEAEHYIFSSTYVASMLRKRQVYAYVNAYAQDIAVVYVPAGVIVDTLCELSTFIVTDLVQSVVVIVEDDAHLHSIDTLQLIGGARSVICYVGARAHLTMTIEYFGGSVEFVGAYAVYAERDSSVIVTSVARAGYRTKLLLDIFLQGSGANVAVSGVYAQKHTDQITLITEQHHAAPDTTSVVRMHGCLANTAQATYHGTIFIAPAAHRSNAEQRNDVLLLSEKARAITVPTLEALADDIHCAHGTALGTVDHNQVLYLQARGIDAAQARACLIAGFLRDGCDTHGVVEQAVQRAIDYITSNT